MHMHVLKARTLHWSLSCLLSSRIHNSPYREYGAKLIYFTVPHVIQSVVYIFKMFWEIFGLIGTLLACGILFMYIRAKKMGKFWRNRGFAFVSSSEVGGQIWNMLNQVRVTDLDIKFYNILKKRNLPYAGFLEFNNPCLYVNDLEVAKHVLVKDFDHFVNRRDFNNNATDITQKMLFFMESEPWKELRTKMSPTFTTGKIRRMFAVVENCGSRLVEYLQEEIKTSPTVNFVDGYGKYTIDVIASAAFGLESGAFREKKSIFEGMAERLQVKASFVVMLKFITLFFLPKLSQLLNLQLFDEVATSFFSSTISKAISHRIATGEKRDDFLQLMLEASAGQLKAEEEELDAFEKDAIVNAGAKDKPKVMLTDDVICAQSILFFLAGFDTTQTLLQFAAYQLAVCPEAQEILAEEVTRSYEKNGNKFTYESINEMEYMDKFVNETLRMFPPVPRLDRRCTKDYTIPGTDLVVPAGTLVVIPTYGIHFDEDIYPDPQKFDPERFSKEAKAERSPYAFLPFGHGPRNCIGMRFALTESKVAIAHLVRSFVFEPSEKTPIPMVLDRTFSVKPMGGMWLNIKPRTS